MKSKIFSIILISLFILLSTKSLLSKQVPLADLSTSNTNDPSNNQPANTLATPTPNNGNYFPGGTAFYTSMPLNSGSQVNGVGFGISQNSDGSGFFGFTNNPFFSTSPNLSWANLNSWNANIYGNSPANTASPGNSGTWVNLENSPGYNGNINTPSITGNTMNSGAVSNTYNTINPGYTSNTSNQGSSSGLNGNSLAGSVGVYNSPGLSTAFSSNLIFNGMQSFQAPPDSANIYGSVMPFGSLTNNSSNNVNSSNWCWQPCYCSSQGSSPQNICWCWFPCWCWVYSPQVIGYNSNYSASPPVPNVAVPNVPATL